MMSAEVGMCTVVNAQFIVGGVKPVSSVPHGLTRPSQGADANNEIEQDAARREQSDPAGVADFPISRTI